MTQGNVFHGNVNFGHSHDASISGATTNTYNYGSDSDTSRLLRLITELQQTITEHQRQLTDAEGLRESVDMLREQVESGNPKPSRLRALLTSIVTMAGNVTAISNAVSAIRNAI